MHCILRIYALLNQVVCSLHTSRTSLRHLLFIHYKHSLRQYDKHLVSHVINQSMEADIALLCCCVAAVALSESDMSPRLEKDFRQTNNTAQLTRLLDFGRRRWSEPVMASKNGERPRTDSGGPQPRRAQRCPLATTILTTTEATSLYNYYFVLFYNNSHENFANLR